MDDARDPIDEPPTVAPAEDPASQRTAELTRQWYVTIPRRIESHAPRLADAFADGAWTAIWPKVAAYAPVAGLIVGFAVAMLLAFIPLPHAQPNVLVPGYPRVWSELLPFMMLVIAAGILHGAAGAGLLAGYVAGDVLRTIVIAPLGGWDTWGELDGNPIIALLMLVGSALISYLLLAIPAVTLPMIARTFAERAPLRRVSNMRMRMLARLGTYALAAGLLTFFWTRGVVVLIRPIFMWRNGSPTVDAIQPVQFQWEWLVATAVIAVVLRVALQELVVRRSSRVGRITSLQVERWADAAPGAFWHRIGPIPLIAMVAATATLLLAGTYEDLIDPVLVFAIAALATAWRSGMIRPTAAWVQMVERVPAIARLAIAGLLGYAMARIVLELMWSGSSLRPVLIGIVLVGAVFVALFPARARTPRPQPIAEPA